MVGGVVVVMAFMFQSNAPRRFSVWIRNPWLGRNRGQLQDDLGAIFTKIPLFLRKIQVFE